MFKTTSFLDIVKNPFTYKERKHRARAQAIIELQANSPTLVFGSVTIVNPVYRGPNPYRGPELSDPANRGKVFIPIRSARQGRS